MVSASCRNVSEPARRAVSAPESTPVMFQALMVQKEARKTPNRPQHRVQRVVNTVNIHGGFFTNLQLAAGENAEESMSVTNGTDVDIVKQLISILEQQGKPISPHLESRRRHWRARKRAISSACQERYSFASGRGRTAALKAVMGWWWKASSVRRR